MHHDIVRQVFIQAPQPVTQPGTKTWSTGNLTASLYVCDCRIVVDCFRKRTVHHTQFFGDLRRVWQQFTDPNAIRTIVVLVESILTGANGQPILLIRRHSRHSLAIANVIRQLFVELVFETRFVVPQIQMARPATHEQINHAPRFRGMMQPV